MTHVFIISITQPSSCIHIRLQHRRINLPHLLLFPQSLIQFQQIRPELFEKLHTRRIKPHVGKTTRQLFAGNIQVEVGIGQPSVNIDGYILPSRLFFYVKFFPNLSWRCCMNRV